ncbi:unnamed protein product [Sphagnum jensenii]|uniref:Uncharacterized protein n=1 Tax=Sphagnum jensenii TaxID=128206 RepID=A0ABP0VT17_9BRYO
MCLISCWSSPQYQLLLLSPDDDIRSGQAALRLQSCLKSRPPTSDSSIATHACLASHLLLLTSSPPALPLLVYSTSVCARYHTCIQRIAAPLSDLKADEDRFRHDAKVQTANKIESRTSGKSSNSREQQPQSSTACMQQYGHFDNNKSADRHLEESTPNPKKYLSQQKDRREDSQGRRYANRTL